MRCRFERMQTKFEHMPRPNCEATGAHAQAKFFVFFLIVCCAGWRRKCCRAVVSVVVGGWCGGVLVTGSGRSSSTQLDTKFSLVTFALVVRGSTPRIWYRFIINKSWNHKVIPSLSYEMYLVLSMKYTWCVNVSMWNLLGDHEKWISYGEIRCVGFLSCRVWGCSDVFYRQCGVCGSPPYQHHISKHVVMSINQCEMCLRTSSAEVIPK